MPSSCGAGGRRELTSTDVPVLEVTLLLVTITVYRTAGRASVPSCLITLIRIRLDIDRVQFTYHIVIEPLCFLATIIADNCQY